MWFKYHRYTYGHKTSIDLPSKISHIVIAIYPIAMETAYGKPKVICFDVRSVSILTSIDDMDAFVLAGKHAAEDLLRTICRLLIFEYTTKGVKLCVNGM